jgi:hypothetical protein
MTASPVYIRITPITPTGIAIQPWVVFVGNSISFAFAFVAADGSFVTPSIIQVETSDPSQTLAAVSYAADPVNAGGYIATFTPTVPGVWWYRISCAGPVSLVEEYWITAVPSLVGGSVGTIDGVLLQTGGTLLLQTGGRLLLQT